MGDRPGHAFHGNQWTGAQDLSPALAPISAELRHLTGALDKYPHLFKRADVVGSWATQNPARMPDRAGPGTSDIDLMVTAKPYGTTAWDRVDRGAHWKALAKIETTYKKQFRRPIHLNLEPVMNDAPHAHVWQGPDDNWTKNPARQGV